MSQNLNRRNIPSIGILLAGCQGVVLVENFHRLINPLYLARVLEYLSFLAHLTRQLQKP